MTWMHGLQGFATAIALAIGIAMPADAASPYSAGLVDITATDPVKGGSMPGVVVYPTQAAGGPLQRGPYTIDATAGPPPAAGTFPLVIMSHGTGGSELGHHDSLTALARAGFIAAALQHPHDNYRDDSGFGTDLQTIGRAHHVVAFIDALLADPRIGGLIDRARIGVAGFSAGGYTALLVIGARPNFALFADYAKAEPDDVLMQRARAAGDQRRAPGLDVVADARVRAAFVMAPALGFAFDREGLAPIRVPVRLYRAGADEILRHPWNAERVRTLLPAAPEYKVLDGAGHYVFLAPCAASMAMRTPEICRDPPGIDRVAIHEMLNAEMVDFFQRTLTQK